MSSVFFTNSIIKVHFAIIFFCSLSPEMKLQLFKVICRFILLVKDEGGKGFNIPVVG